MVVLTIGSYCKSVLTMDCTILNGCQGEIIQWFEAMTVVLKQWWISIGNGCFGIEIMNVNNFDRLRNGPTCESFLILLIYEIARSLPSHRSRTRLSSLGSMLADIIAHIVRKQSRTKNIF